MTTVLNTSTFDINDDWGMIWHEPFDVNNDGLYDLIVYSNSVRSWAPTIIVPPEAYLRIYIQNPDGSISDKTSDFIVNPLSQIAGTDMSLGDLNADGVIDIVLGGSGRDPFDPFSDGTTTIIEEYGEPDVIYLSQSNGTWHASSPIARDIWTHNVAVGDLNGDGRDDFFSSSIEDGDNKTTGFDIERSFVTLSQPSNEFTANQFILPSILTSPNQFFVDYSRLSYVDNDGKTIYYGTTFTGSTVFDANGDGHPDLAVLADGLTKENLIFLNDGNGRFSDEKFIRLPESIFGYGGATEYGASNLLRKGTVAVEGNAADIDQDGDLDLVILSTFQNDRPDEPVVSYAGTGLQILKNDGNGNFTVSQNIVIGEGVDRTYLNDFEFYDLNRDGQIDIIGQGTHYNDDYYKTEIFLNSGGTFSNSTSTFIDSKDKQYFPFHRDGELHFFSYEFDWVSTDPRDGEANAVATFTTLRSDIPSGAIIAGRDEAEYLLGSDRNETFLISGGNDMIDGGGGLDIARISSLRSDIAIANDGDGSFTLSLNGNAISLSNVERIELSEGSVALDLGGSAGQTYRLYQAAFDRTPDTVGLSNNVGLVDNGMSLHDMANAFAQSPEFLATYGTTTNEQFVNTLYNNVLGRNADPAGLAGWLDTLASGRDRGFVLTGFSESPENIALVAPAINDGIWLG